MTITAIAAPADEPCSPSCQRRAHKRGQRGRGRSISGKTVALRVPPSVLTTAGTQKRVRAYGRTYDEARKKLMPSSSNNRTRESQSHR